MSSKLKIDPEPMTYAGFKALGSERNRPSHGMEGVSDQEVEALERDFGPQVPAFLCRKGRPRKGTDSSPVQPRVVKMPPAFWKAMAELAQEQGLTLHAAMREALLAWARDHAQPKAG